MPKKGPRFASNTSVASSLISDSSSISSKLTSRKVSIRLNPAEFENTRPHEVRKCELCIINKESYDVKISILPIQEPFFINKTKHKQITVQSLHIIKIPIEFKPLMVNEYKDNIIVRVDSYESPLSCVVYGKCVA